MQMILIERLTTDFNLAVEAYNKADYYLFFRNIRPAIENFSKLLIFDLLGNDTQATALIDGNASINYVRAENLHRISKSPDRPKPVIGSALPRLFARAFYYKHPDVFSSRVDQNKKHIKQSIDSYEAQLCQYYSIASEIGAHSGATSLDEETQARSCASFIMSFLDYLKSQKLISKDAIAVIDSFRHFSFGDARVKNDLEDQISKLTDVLKKKEEQLQNSQQLQDEAAERNQQSKQIIENLKAEISRLEQVISSLQSEMSDGKSEETPAEETPATPEADHTSLIEQPDAACQWEIGRAHV